MAIKRLKKITRQEMVAYIEAILMKGYTKKDAFLEFIDPEAKDVHSRINTMENRAEFYEIYKTLNSDSNLQIQETINRVKKKYAALVEKNIDKATEVLDQTETIKDKATAIRLVNETVGALSIMSGNTTPDKQPRKLDRGASVIR